VLDHGNIDADPIFVDQDGADNIPGNADDDLHLNNGSPCIDSGNDGFFPVSMPALDFDGNPRILDDPLSPGSASDMGAYEFVPGSGTGGGSNNLPVASFTYAIGAGNQVTFTDTSTDIDGSLVQWNWNFGDGTSSVTNSPVHTFSGNGTYTVTLVVRDDQNGTDLSDPATVTVSGLTTGSVSILSPPNGSIVSGTVPLAVDATPDIVRVKLYIDGVYTEQKDTSPPFSIDWDSTGVADGQHTIEFKTNDDTDTDEGVFWTAPITVTVQNTVPPTPLEAWRSDHFTAAELANPALEATLWGISADADDDGLSNDTEFALGTNPRDSSDSNGGVSVSVVSETGGKLVYLTYRRRSDDPDLHCAAELCHDLSCWDAANLETLSVLDQGDGYELVTARELPSPQANRRAFVRVTVTRTP
jgi:PKD repeat protein